MNADEQYSLQIWTKHQQKTRGKRGQMIYLMRNLKLVKISFGIWRKNLETENRFLKKSNIRFSASILLKSNQV